MPDNITLLTLPPYAPELNPMENVWEYLRKNKLAITVFNDYVHIIDKSCDAWNFFAERTGRHCLDHMPRMGTGQALGRLVSVGCDSPSFATRWRIPWPGLISPASSISGRGCAIQAI